VKGGQRYTRERMSKDKAQWGGSKVKEGRSNRKENPP